MLRITPYNDFDFTGALDGKSLRLYTAMTGWQGGTGERQILSGMPLVGCLWLILESYQEIKRMIQLPNLILTMLSPLGK